MNLWLTAAVALLCALAGVALGWAFSRLKSPYWVIGYVFPLVLVFAYALAFRVPAIMFTPPFSWMMMGIKRFAMFGFVATAVLTTPLSRVPQARNRTVIVLLMALIGFYVAVWPFLSAIVDRPQLARLKTNIDADGI